MKIFKDKKSELMWGMRLITLFFIAAGLFVYLLASNMIPFFSAREDVLNGYGNILMKMLGLWAICIGIVLLLFSFIPDSVIKRFRKNKKQNDSPHPPRLE